MKLTIGKGATVKEIILEDGTPLIKIGHGVTGLIGGVPVVIPHAFCDVTNDLAEVTVDAVLTYISDHVTEVDASKENVVLSNTKELFFKLIL